MMSSDSMDMMMNSSKHNDSDEDVSDRYVEKRSTLHKSKTQGERQLLHPLELNDKLAFETIKTVRLDFLTDEAIAPIPRCQALPPHAFSRLTGRSILVSLSHGWFFQAHPDPNGEKLDLIRNVFAPRLRKRYPHTDIQVFFDYLASPQRPRTKEEDKVFAVAMDRMNSMYVYADVIVFLEVELPRLDMTIHSAVVDLSTYKFFDFVDTVQVSETTSKNGPQQLDCIETCDSSTVNSASQLNSLTDTHTLTYLHRPFGRPNTIINDDRGWLFLERITIAVKAAAADKSQFDDIVVSNSEKLRTQIFVWTEQLREAARKQKKTPRALRDLLEDFDKELQSKLFSFTSDESVVRELMTKLINQFAHDWKGEVEKQISMSKRAREILLRWGCFSEDYVERAELLCDSQNVKSRRSCIFLSVVVGVFVPVISVCPFLISLEEDGEDPTQETFSLLVSSIWMGVLIPVCGVSVFHGLMHAFLKIPIGTHTIVNWFSVSCIMILVSIMLRKINNNTVLGFELIVVAILGLALRRILFIRLQIIPIRETRTDQTNRWAISQFFLPESKRFDPKVTTNVNRVQKTRSFSIAFALIYPVLGGLFFQSETFIQALLIPVFFILRAGFEYGADAITSHTFGSDGMPAINFGGVMMHEICLSVMITSIKHPLVFISLVLSDVLENMFCLWSLARNSQSSNRVSPGAADDKEKEVKQRKKSLTRRSSNVVSLVMNKNDVSDKGTALFIAATLLQREAVETLVPLQAAAVLSLLYKVDVKSNSIVSGWSEEDWTQSMIYIGVDLGVELVIFLTTMMMLRRIYPEFDAGRILRGLLRTHWLEMTMISVAVWIGNLLIQSTYTGMDMTMKFEWLSCKSNSNSIWLGGFDWRC